MRQTVAQRFSKISPNGRRMECLPLKRFILEPFNKPLPCANGVVMDTEVIRRVYSTHSPQPGWTARCLRPQEKSVPLLSTQSWTEEVISMIFHEKPENVNSCALGSVLDAAQHTVWRGISWCHPVRRRLWPLPQETGSPGQAGSKGKA